MRKKILSSLTSYLYIFLCINIVLMVREKMNAELERIIEQYKRSRDSHFASFACADITMLINSNILDRWVQENNNGNDLVPGDVYAKLILKERLRQWKQKYNCEQHNIENIYNSILSS